MLIFSGIIFLLLYILPACGISVIYNFSSTSMLPTLSEDALIFTDQTPFEELVVGDIIVFRKWFSTTDENAAFYDRGIVNSGNPEIIHRIVRIDENSDRALITKGDNCEYIDTRPIFKSDYVEKVFLYPKYFGKLVKLLIQKKGMLWYNVFLLVFSLFELVYVLCSHKDSDSTQDTTPRTRKIW